MFSTIEAFVVAHWRLLCEALMLVGLLTMYECRVSDAKSQAATLEKGFALQAQELALTKAQLVTAAQAKAALPTVEQPRATAMIKAGGKIAEVVSGVVAVADTPKVVETKTAAGETYSDEYHRFNLFVTPTGLATMARNQTFKITGTVYVGADKTTRFADMAFREYDPSDDTKEIPSTGVKMAWRFDQVNVDAPAVSPWHTRLVALAAPTAGFGAGAQWNPWRGLIVTLGASYGTKNGVSGIAGLGWRLRLPWIDSTLGLSMGYAYSAKGGSVQPVGTVEITR